MHRMETGWLTGDFNASRSMRIANVRFGSKAASRLLPAGMGGKRTLALRGSCLSVRLAAPLDFVRLGTTDGLRILELRTQG